MPPNISTKTEPMRFDGVIPKPNNIPPLSINIEGLRKHSMACIFIEEPNLSDDERKLRAWLLHTLVTAARHYSKARDLAVQQDAIDQARDGGFTFYVLEIAEHIEGCVMAMHKVCTAIKRMSAAASASAFSTHFRRQIDELSSIRNQFEHMHSQIVTAQTGSGPISITYYDDGSSIRFRSLAMKTEDVHGLLEGAFVVVAEMFPAFNIHSAPTAAGPAKLSLKLTMPVQNKMSDQK